MNRRLPAMGGAGIVLGARATIGWLNQGSGLPAIRELVPVQIAAGRDAVRPDPRVAETASGGSCVPGLHGESRVDYRDLRAALAAAGHSAIRADEVMVALVDPPRRSISNFQRSRLGGTTTAAPPPEVRLLSGRRETARARLRVPDAGLFLAEARG